MFEQSTVVDVPRYCAIHLKSSAKTALLFPLGLSVRLCYLILFNRCDIMMHFELSLDLFLKTATPMHDHGDSLSFISNRGARTHFLLHWVIAVFCFLPSFTHLILPYYVSVIIYHQYTFLLSFFLFCLLTTKLFSLSWFFLERYVWQPFVFPGQKILVYFFRAVLNGSPFGHLARYPNQ